MLEEGLLSKTNEVKSLQIGMTQKENRIQCLETSLTTCNETIAMLEPELSSKKEEVDKLTNQLHADEDKIQALETQLNTSKGTIAELEQSLVEMRAEVSSVSAVNEVLQSQLTAAVEGKQELMSRLDIVQGICADMTAQYESGVSTIASLKGEFEDCSGRLKMTEQKLEELTSQHNILSHSHATSQNEIEKLIEANSYLEGQVQGLTASNEQLHTDKTRADQMNVSMKNQCESLENEIQQLRSEVEEMSDALAEADNKILDKINEVGFDYTYTTHL